MEEPQAPRPTARRPPLGGSLIHMAKAAGHKFGQFIGEYCEKAIEPLLKEFADKHGLFLDKAGNRPARSGKKVKWIDSYGNSHNLDYVLERGGTPEKVGTPVAFIESAWRRYTKHSRAGFGQDVPPNSYQASGGKRADGCVSQSEGPSAKQTVNRRSQTCASVITSRFSFTLALFHPGEEILARTYGLGITRKLHSNFCLLLFDF